MDARMREKRRQQIARCRRRPLQPQRIYFPAGGIGECIEIEPARPIELCIEATDALGNVVPWLTDEWWIRTHSFCKDRTVTVVLLPTPRNLLDEVVLHQMAMVRRIAPKWRIFGYALYADAQTEPDIERWLGTPYDEIRFCEDTHMPDSNGSSKQAQALVSQAAAALQPKGRHHALMRMTRMLPDPLSYQGIQNTAISRTPPEHVLKNSPFIENIVQST